MSGHGGDGFLKFQVWRAQPRRQVHSRGLSKLWRCELQDFEEISSQDIADSIQEMHVKKRYNEIFFMVDTCQAGSLSNTIVSPKVVTIGSSQTGENSYAHHSDQELGLSVIDRFTFSTLDYLQQMKVGDSIRNGTLRDLFNFYNPRVLFSTPDYRDDILGRSIDTVPITDFFGSVLDIRLQDDEEAYPIQGAPVASLHAEQARSVEKEPSSSQGNGAEQSTRGVWGGTKESRTRRFQFSGEFFLFSALFAVAAVIVTATKV
jgi:phosphatidylinositol glycan class K